MSRTRRTIARRLANSLPTAACHGRAQWWAMKEAEYAAARTARERSYVARPVFTLCAGCPVLLQCAEWAEVYRYTGLAAGAAYRDGRKEDHRNRHGLGSGHAARVTVAMLLAHALPRGACHGRGHWWTHHETQHIAAMDPASRQAAARPAFELCSTCPITARCRLWAEVDSYTGLAAGSAYRDGQRIDHTARNGQPSRRRSIDGKRTPK